MTMISQSAAAGQRWFPSFWRNPGAELWQLLRSFFGRARLSDDLAKLSDRQLRDIGVTRHDLQAAIQAPLDADPAGELMDLRHLRSTNW